MAADGCNCALAVARCVHRLSASTAGSLAAHRRRLPAVRPDLPVRASRGREPRTEASGASGAERLHARSIRTGAVSLAQQYGHRMSALMRFLSVRGDIEPSLVDAVPRAAQRYLAPPKPVLDAGDVSRLLGSCDRRRAAGRRDYALLTLLVRLGLRAAEAAALRVDDVHWRVGEIVVSGKGGSRERLPLPMTSGERSRRTVAGPSPRPTPSSFPANASALWRAVGQQRQWCGAARVCESRSAGGRCAPPAPQRRKCAASCRSAAGPDQRSAAPPPPSDDRAIRPRRARGATRCGA